MANRASCKETNRQGRRAREALRGEQHAETLAFEAFDQLELLAMIDDRHYQYFGGFEAEIREDAAG
jgi:hypothetical protein